MRYAPRNLLVVLLLCTASGCHLWGGKNKTKAEGPRVDNFTDTQPKARPEEEDAQAGMTKPAKFRPAENSGTGFSNTARDIERSLGYER